MYPEQGRSMGEQMRKLASIRIISAIHPIENKDRIELAIVDGWQSIVKKGEYTVGDKTIFLETDSVVPKDIPYFAFLEKTKYRIKTMKMAGVISQGLCAPLSLLPNDHPKNEGDDVTDVLGILKWDNSISESKQEEGNHRKVRKYPKWLMRHAWFRKLVLPKKKNKGFPAYIQKTDETRIQNSPWILRDSKILWTVREKLDGQSATFVLKRVKKRLFRKNDFEFIVCSRNIRLGREDNSNHWQIARKFKIKDVLLNLIGPFDDYIAMQGEIIGPKIQGNKYGLGDLDFYVFNLIYPTHIDNGTGFYHEFRTLKWCPLIDETFIMPDTVNELLDYATGKSVLADTMREGFVFRTRQGTSVKAVSPEFLMKHDE